MAGMGLNDNEHDIHAKLNGQHGYGLENLSTANFFREEYQLNYKIASQSPNIPQISIWDGIVMGGGVGLSAHGMYRVATEDCIFAMPETNIGFFPDVGSTYLLSRLKGGIGNYIALTGARLKPDDLIYTGLATHYVPSKNIDDMVDDIVAKSTDISNTSSSATSSINASTSVDIAASVLMSYHEEISRGESYIARHRDEIDELFYEPESVENIMAALEKSNTIFACTTLEMLRKMSPTSLKVTLEGIRRGRHCSDIAGCLKMEYRMSQAFMREGSDFYEGIRAALVDKDRKPKWNLKLEEIADDHIESYFSCLGDKELDLSEGFVRKPSNL